MYGSLTNNTVTNKSYNEFPSGKVTKLKKADEQNASACKLFCFEGIRQVMAVCLSNAIKHLKGHNAQPRFLKDII